MNRAQRRKLGLKGTTPAQLIQGLERLGPILWEPDPQPGRREGWAVCPCCGDRELWVSVPVEDDREAA